MHKDDRDLLELAAKAADIEHGADRLDCGLSITLQNGQHRSLPRWNPLDDDADALRLAVCLSLVVEPGTCWITKFGPVYREDVLPDPYAATRRAITRAAAEIGRSME